MGSALPIIYIAVIRFIAGFLFLWLQMNVNKMHWAEIRRNMRSHLIELLVRFDFHFYRGIDCWRHPCCNRWLGTGLREIVGAIDWAKHSMLCVVSFRHPYADRSWVAVAELDTRRGHHSLENVVRFHKGHVEKWIRYITHQGGDACHIEGKLLSLLP